ncbi:MAG: alpha/beta fold hydrolase [Halioglobus sp.]
MRLSKILSALLLAAFVGYAYISLVHVPKLVTASNRIDLVERPSDVGLDYEEFQINPAQENLNLNGWWMPASNPQAVLVFIHGAGSGRHSTFFSSLDFYAKMVENHISVVAIDLRNHGTSDGDEHGLQYGRTESADAMAAINWARQHNPGMPAFAMGISMGGATIIHAAGKGAPLDGLILLDPLLDTHSAVRRGATVETPLPAWFFGPAAWAATTFHGLPSGEQQALSIAKSLSLPILLIQDPDDPVTIIKYADELAEANPQVTYWVAPPVDLSHPDLAWKGAWGSHVAAFHMFPDETTQRVVAFIDR